MTSRKKERDKEDELIKIQHMSNLVCFYILILLKNDLYIVKMTGFFRKSIRLYTFGEMREGQSKEKIREVHFCVITRTRH